MRKTAAVGLAALLVTGACVSSARFRQEASERERLAKENLELRRALAEQRVRAQEALEALGASPRPAAPAAAAAARAPVSVQQPSAASVAAFPQGFGGEAVDILDEDVRSETPPGTETAGGAEALLRVARRYAAERRPREAVDAYSRLIVDHPFSPALAAAFLERGRMRLELGQTEGALEDFDTVAEAFPGSPQAPEARRRGAALRKR